MSDQWGASASQPDGSWPPQPAPAPSYPGGPSQQYPTQPPAPPAPAPPYAAEPYSAGPYAAEPYSTEPYAGQYGAPYSGPYSGEYSAQHAGPYAQPPQPQPAQQEQPASSLNWGPPQTSQPSYGQTGYPAPDPYAASAGPIAPPQQAPQHAPQHAQPQPQPQSQPPQPQAQPQPQPQAQPQQPYPRPQLQPEPPQPYQQSGSLYTSVPPPPPTYSPEASFASQPVPYPQAPGSLPVEAPAGPGARPTNPFAVIGAVMSVVPFVGLILSIIGLGKAKVRGGIGRSVATLGIVLSLIFIPAWCAAGYLVYKDVGTTAADPACVAAEGDYLTSTRTLDADAAAMARTTYGTRQFTDAVKTYESDFQVLIESLQADSGRAENADVHTAIVSMIADLQQLKTMMGDLASGDFTAAGRLGDVSTLNNKLFSDYEHTRSVCTSRH